jgi:hypothetical protein
VDNPPLQSPEAIFNQQQTIVWGLKNEHMRGAKVIFNGKEQELYCSKINSVWIDVVYQTFMVTII